MFSKFRILSVKPLAFWRPDPNNIILYLLLSTFDRVCCEALCKHLNRFYTIGKRVYEDTLVHRSRWLQIQHEH